LINLGQRDEPRPNRPFYRNYLPSVLRLKDANIGSVVFKKAKVFNSIKVSGGYRHYRAVIMRYKL
jgi:hypothetical protein